MSKDSGMKKTNKFLIYRIESVLLMTLFFSAFALMIRTGQIAWIIPGWVGSIVLGLHLYRVRCPRCSHKVMMRSAPKKYQNKWFIFFPGKCDKCDLALL